MDFIRHRPRLEAAFLQRSPGSLTQHPKILERHGLRRRAFDRETFIDCPMSNDCRHRRLAHTEQNSSYKKQKINA